MQLESLLLLDYDPPVYFSSWSRGCHSLGESGSNRGDGFRHDGKSRNPGVMLETRLVKGMTEKRRTYLVNPPLSLPSCKAMWHQTLCGAETNACEKSDGEYS
jgi:hypothetical protein